MDKGPGLAFKAYPQALSLMPGASIWSVVFCFMLIPVALGSATCHVETVAAEFVGQYAFSSGLWFRKLGRPEGCVRLNVIKDRRTNQPTDKINVLFYSL